MRAILTLVTMQLRCNFRMGLFPASYRILIILPREPNLRKARVYDLLGILQIPHCFGKNRRALRAKTRTTVTLGHLRQGFPIKTSCTNHVTAALLAYPRKRNKIEKNVYIWSTLHDYTKKRNDPRTYLDNLSNNE